MSINKIKRYKLLSSADEGDSKMEEAGGDDEAYDDIQGIVETEISDLPNELLEVIFSKLSPYDDMDNAKLVCKRWLPIVKNVILNKKSSFEGSLLTGSVESVTCSAVINEQGNIVPPGSWAAERFGHMACYYDKSLYILGGTTHTPTTFNDLWRFDLSTLKWSRMLASGQYPTPKALASACHYKNYFVVYGGWSHPSSYPLMQPWRIYDELSIFNFSNNCWTLMVNSVKSPLPTAGHTASIAGQNLMLIFGGRVFNAGEQSYPLSNDVWVFNFLTSEWHELTLEGQGEAQVKIKPPARYGHTQVTLDDNHILIIGGCGGPNQVFADVWLLTLINSSRPHQPVMGRWEKIKVINPDKFTANEFHYYGCKIGNSVAFLERSSPISPFLAFLQYDAQNPAPGGQQGLNFEPSRQRYFHSRCSSGLSRRNTQPSTSMSIYTLDVSQVISDKTAKWSKEDESTALKYHRPKERLLYSMVEGRSELVLFGGFYKDHNSPRCRVSSDVFIIKQLQKQL